MRYLVLLFIAILLACSDSPVAGGGDDFPSMITLAGVEMSKAINGELTPQSSLLTQSASVESISSLSARSAARGVSISGDTLWYDTSYSMGDTAIVRNYALYRDDLSKLYRIREEKVWGADTQFTDLTDFDGDGLLFDAGTNSLIAAAFSGSIDGTTILSQSGQLIWVQYANLFTAQELYRYYQKGNDSLVEPGDTLMAEWVFGRDTILVEAVAYGNDADLTNDTLRSLAYNSASESYSIQMEMALEGTFTVNNLFSAGTIGVTLERNDTVLVLNGTFDSTITVTTPQGDTIEYKRDGTLLRR